MRFSARLQVLTCLVLYASSAQAIMVKYGTKGGPIVPAAPEPVTPPQPYRSPAPVWEERTIDTPDPNAHWRPPYFVPQSRYTNVITNEQTQRTVPLNNAQRFVHSYIPVKVIQPHQNGANIAPAILGSQSIPGIGLRYFFPVYQTTQKPARQEDAKLNQIDGHDVVVAGAASASDFQWIYEKEATRRNLGNTLEGTARTVYQWPVYVPPRHH